MYTLDELLRLVELMEQNASKRADRPGDHTKEGAVDRVHWLAQASAYGEVKDLVKKMIAANKSNNLTTNKI